MLTHEEHQAMIMFDRLLMAAKDNETIADLLDQTLNVARMIDPRPDEKVSYGPLQRMHFEWQQLKHRMSELDKKMDQYLNQQNRYGATYPNTGMYPNTGSMGYATGSSTWPSNPGLDISTGYGAIPPSSFSDLNKYASDYEKHTINHMTEQLRKLAEDAKDAK
jgi:hypothetical protein